MNLFLVKKKGSDKHMEIFAKNTRDAKIKAIRLLESGKMFKVKGKLVSSSAVPKSRILFRGVRK